MCMGSGKKKTTIDQTTTATNTVEPWLNTASQQAVTQGQTIANTPFTRYGGEMTAGLTGNQKSASSLAASTASPGTAASNYAKANMNTGMSSADLDAMLARIGAASAAGNQGAGLSDLEAARGYTTGSAAPITASDISTYINPYINQAIDPAAERARLEAARTGKQIANTSAMSGAFGGSRSGLREATNDSNLTNTIAQLYGTGYSDAYDKALAQVNADKARQAGAAGLSLQTASGANTQASDALSRLISAAGAAGEAGKTQSGLTSDALSRLTAAQGSENTLTNDALSRLASTGLTEQATNQAADTAAYTEFLRGQGWSTEQLNALLSALGVAKGASNTTTTADTKGVTTAKDSIPFLAQLAAVMPSG